MIRHWIIELWQRWVNARRNKAVSRRSRRAMKAHWDEKKRCYRQKWW